MIDLHIHCLPGIDDGPETMEVAVELCRAAGRDGCETLVATPHQGHAYWDNTSPGALEEARDRLQKALGGGPAVLLGGEIHIGSELLDCLEDPTDAGFRPLAGSSYLLLEYPRSGIVADPEELVHELSLGGWRVIFAHPEFIAGLGDDLDLMERLQDAGAHFQVTAAALTGDFGRRAARRVGAMFDRDLIQFVASDGHRLPGRPPGLAMARRLVSARWGDDIARAVTFSNPLAVIENRPLDAITTPVALAGLAAVDSFETQDPR